MGEGASSFLPSSLLSVYEFVFIILLFVNFVAALPAAERKRVCVCGGVVVVAIVFVCVFVHKVNSDL